ncbi:MAG: phosphate ABC transporter, permease protein PstA [Tistrella sp.]|uniref:Phosphate transport system permease protein PstA n=1 Tax=Tistrella mobilis TaxID=171437 RepID=A0A3B9IRD8_9PROT|nr:phosphate ABC transporter permease PstA [Tistrella sp.]MAD38204.1 phosphate ABC transporter, permease protein PstA [Tistrella sp.]MBA77098.1 phosphate ABC transporter, permease protein PstA [Tistrella sp.]HAE50365.1 phosphate ABC transporter permease PtsA [Tistrella mobilis]
MRGGAIPVSPARLRRRRLVNLVMTGLCTAAALAALLVLALILWELVIRGAGALSLDVFTRATPPPGSRGGLLNAILGSLSMTAAAIAVATPVGVLTGTWLAEYGRDSRAAGLVRLFADTLLSAPSIIVGLTVYVLLVVPLGHFSGWAGAVALALIAVPVIVRTTEDMLALVPDQLREAAVALGMPRWRMIAGVTWRAAAGGILTGVLLAIARIAGETAPLLFTALNNQFYAWDLTGPTPSLPVVIFQFAMSPYRDWQDLAWAGALLIAAGVLLLSITARLISARGRK